MACNDAGASSVVRAADTQEADWLRQARRLALRALERLGTVRMEDVGVPRGRVPELLLAIERVGQKHGIRIATFGHAGDGNLHVNLLTDENHRVPAVAARIDAALGDIFSATLDLKGTLSGEHGIGIAKKSFLPKFAGDAQMRVMRELRRALDPNEVRVLCFNNLGSCYGTSGPRDTGFPSRASQVQPRDACAQDQHLRGTGLP